MPYHLELGSDGSSFKGKAIVVNTLTGRHYSNDPIPIESAKRQMRVLEQSEGETLAEKKQNKRERREEAMAAAAEASNPGAQPAALLRPIFVPNKRRLELIGIREPDPEPDYSRTVGPADVMRRNIMSLSLFPNIFNSAASRGDPY